MPNPSEGWSAAANRDLLAAARDLVLAVGEKDLAGRRGSCSLLMVCPANRTCGASIHPDPARPGNRLVQ